MMLRSSVSQLNSGDKLVTKRKDEKFKRIKCSTLAKLLAELNPTKESIYSLGDGEEGKVAIIDDAESVHSVQTMKTGVSAVTYNTE